MSELVFAHHWLMSMRGGERVLEELLQLSPGRPIYTLLADQKKLSPLLQSTPLVSSWLQRIPGTIQHYAKFLPFFPEAVSSLHVPESTRFVISSDASVIKGLSIPEGVPHVCYCHSPPRYLWDLQETYLQTMGQVGRAVFSATAPRVRAFDVEAAQRVTDFIANSQFVAQRIRTCYQRDSVVIHPPVSVTEFRWDCPAEDYYLVVSALTPYKRVETVVDAFRGRREKLVVVGTGSEEKRLRALAPPNVFIRGALPRPEVVGLMERCRAFIHPQIEDFGISAVEAQAAGRPVIAFGRGGALETVVEGVTGLFFAEQTADAIYAAIQSWQHDASWFAPQQARAQAEKFSASRFRHEITQFLQTRYGDFFPR
jgi:glycosyltransferase involved in cell wall biosynthesis